MSRSRRLALWAAATDSTFERVPLELGECLVGRCIHCGRKVALRLDGEPISDASLEHIVPRHHGGDDRVENLAIACTRCNNQKGYRHDHRPRADPELTSLVARLLERRRARLRPPLPGLGLPGGDDASACGREKVRQSCAPSEGANELLRSESKVHGPSDARARDVVGRTVGRRVRRRKG